jgi:hypothetical protein
MRTWEGDPLSGKEINISGSDLENGNYVLHWFNTWTGDYLQEADVLSVGGSTWATVPEDFEGEDVALRLEQGTDGAAATEVHLSLVKVDTLLPPAFAWLPPEDSTIFKIACYVTDGEGKMDASYNGPVEILIEYDSEDFSETMEMNLKDGGLLLDYIRRGTSGATVTATIDGLGTGVLIIEGIVGMDNVNVEDQENLLGLETYPNPLRDILHIRFELEKEENVFLGVYSSQGKLLETLVQHSLTSGPHHLIWNPEDHPAGMYLVRLETTEVSVIQRSMLVR